jgi:hypothetical protein
MILLKDRDDPRRRLLLQALAAGVLGLGLPARYALAQILGKVPDKLPPGRSIYEMNGEVKVNNSAAGLETQVKTNDTVETGPNGRVAFVVGQDAFLMRSNSKLTVRGQGGIVETVQLFAGKLLSVFGKTRHQVRTPTAIVGIRGTGVYTEADPELTYFCTCYGITDMYGANDPESKETINARHHDAPKYIVANAPAGKRIRPAPFINHTDEELMIIEALVGRTVPFSFSSQDYSAPRREY